MIPSISEQRQICAQRRLLLLADRFDHFVTDLNRELDRLPDAHFVDRHGSVAKAKEAIKAAFLDALDGIEKGVGETPGHGDGDPTVFSKGSKKTNSENPLHPEHGPMANTNSVDFLSNRPCTPSGHELERMRIQFGHLFERLAALRNGCEFDTQGWFDPAENCRSTVERLLNEIRDHISANG